MNESKQHNVRMFDTNLLIRFACHKELAEKNLLNINSQEIIDLMDFLAPEEKPGWSQLPGCALRIIVPAIQEQHPHLRDLDVSALTIETFPRWLEEQAARLGKQLPIESSVPVA